MTGRNHGSAMAEPDSGSEEEIRLAYALSNSQRWDTSTETVRRVYDHLTADREEFLHG